MTASADSLLIDGDRIPSLRTHRLSQGETERTFLRSRWLGLPSRRYRARLRGASPRRRDAGAGELGMRDPLGVAQNDEADPNRHLYSQVNLLHRKCLPPPHVATSRTSRRQTASSRSTFRFSIAHDSRHSTAQGLPELIHELQAGGYVVHMVPREPLTT